MQKLVFLVKNTDSRKCQKSCKKRTKCQKIPGLDKSFYQKSCKKRIFCKKRKIAKKLQKTIFLAKKGDKMEIVKGRIIYTDEEIAYFNRVNPTIFDIAVMVNQQLGDIFYTRGCEEVLKPGMTLATAQSVDVAEVEKCAMNVLMGYYKNENLCGHVTCTMRKDRASCFEYTWKETTGQTEKIDRRRMTYEQRIFLLMKRKGVTVV